MTDARRGPCFCGAWKPGGSPRDRQSEGRAVELEKRSFNVRAMKVLFGSD
jgi:hypothetical protein